MKNNIFFLKPKIIFLMGPTACGKTNLALKLYKYLPIEIISVDSGLIYKYMNIGTGKLSYNQLLKYPHHLINILDPKEQYSAWDFQKDAILIINKILARGKIPLLVGGTMLYYKILLEGLYSLPKSNINIKSKILYNIKKNPSLTLHLKLQKIDPISAKNIHPNDNYRLLRALEVFYISGKKFSDFIYKKKKKKYNIIQFALIMKNKQWLYDRIVKRFRNMINLGFYREMEYLFYRGDLHSNLPSMRCIGYKQMWKYFSSEIDFLNMYKSIIIANMQLAKKQITWLRNWNNILWLDAHNIKKSIYKILSI